MRFIRIAPLLVALASVTTYAAEPPRNDGGSNRARTPHGPPPEALAACKGKSAGSAAQMTTPDGRSMAGKCQLVFIPDQAPPARDAPPPEPKR